MKNPQGLFMESAQTSDQTNNIYKQTQSRETILRKRKGNGVE
jgi:hypothetical protein